MKSRFYIKCWRLLIVMTVFRSAQGQVRIPTEVQTLPAWAGEEAASKTRPPHYVFRDANSQVVVSYLHPGTLGRMITFRFWLANRVDPQIAVSVSRTQVGGLISFAYAYKLKNGSGAATAIKQWSVVAPANEDLTVSHPVWKSLNARVPVAPQALVPNAGAGVYVLWMAADALHISPGAEVGDFMIRSTFSPGLTTAFASDKATLVEPGPGELPEEVVAQLIPLQRPSVWQKPAMTIGPRFAPGTTSQAILGAFDKDVADLIRGGLLLAKSAYVRELQQAFASASADARAQVFSRKVTPSTQLERDLERALKMSVLADR